MVTNVRSDIAKRILVICTDQQRWDSLGCYGSQEVSTPNIDGLAATGTLFERCYAANPVCAPSRATMLTGRYPHQHGLWANGVKLPPGEVSLLRSLGSAGYRTGLVGKLHLGPCFAGRREDPSEYGFDWVRWSHDPPHPSPSNAYHAWLRANFPQRYAAAAGQPATGWTGESHPSGSFADMPADSHYSRWAAEEAIDFICASEQSSRWMLWVNFFDPHHPFVAPEQYLSGVRSRPRRRAIGSAGDLEGRPAALQELSARSYAGAAKGFREYTDADLEEARVAYWAMVDLVDEQVGRILTAAEASGAPEELFVLFVSDHGEMLGDHGLMLKGPMMYEGAVRVPCILRWPARVPAGLRSEGLVSLLDVARTLGDAAGVEPSPADRGRSLVSVATGELPARQNVVCEYRNSGHSYDPPVMTTMIADRRYKAIVWHGHPELGTTSEGELYDLEGDPCELHNLWDDPKLAVEKARLLTEMSDVLVPGDARWWERLDRW